MSQLNIDPDPTPTGVDPDPTPTATPWEEYLATAQSLDAVCRDAAAAAATRTAAAKATSAARAELAQLTERLGRQRGRLTGEAVRYGLAAPQLAPSAAEQAAADAVVAGDPAAVPEALRRGQQLVEAADTALAAALPPLTLAVPSGPPAPAPPVSPAPPPGRTRTGLPSRVWLMILVPLGIAAFLACAAALVVIAIR